MGRTILIWVITVVITLSSVVYQRLTGPTHPARGSVEIGGKAINYRLLRSHETTGDAELSINIPDTTISGMIRWKRFPSHDEWTIETLKREGKALVFSIPAQPMAGKVMYDITLLDDNGNGYKLTDEPVVMRFKGAVPGFVLWPHVVIMFVGMLLATRTGMEALTKGKKIYGYSLVTTILLVIGGLILGPIVQKYAFDAFWTGWPFGHDLTDNKTFAAAFMWIIAIWRCRGGKGGRGWVIAAAVVTLLVYLIPHSVLGSEIDYTQMNSQT